MIFGFTIIYEPHCQNLYSLPFVTLVLNRGRIGCVVCTLGHGAVPEMSYATKEHKDQCNWNST